MSYLAKFINEVKGKEYFILDTETTGLNGEVIQIAIIDHEKTVHFDSLIKPKYPIPVEATAIHGISNETVENAPVWGDVSGEILSLLQDQLVIVYNAVFDRKMMHHSAEYWELPRIDWKQEAFFYCAMESYAEFFGAWNDWKGSYTWQKLQNAASSVGYRPERAHTALSDCLSTWHVVEMLLMQDPKRAEMLYKGSTGDEDY